MDPWQNVESATSISLNEADSNPGSDESQYGFVVHDMEW